MCTVQGRRRDPSGNASSVSPQIPPHVLSPSSADYNHRVHLCWREQRCLSCLASPHRCGWCADSSTCLPLPRSPIPLLHPIVSSTICPFYDDRWELRTATLGCKVSTMTVMVCIVTVACTIVGLALLGLLWKGIRACLPWVGQRSGWRIEIVKRDAQDSWRKEGSWRRTATFSQWWRRVFGRRKHEGIIDERRRLLAD